MKKFLYLILIYSSIALGYDGANIHPNDYQFSNQVLFNILKKYNINSVRTDYPWNDIEKNSKGLIPPQNKVDGFLLSAKSNNIKPIVILDYGNKFYNIYRPTDKTSISKFEEYVKWTVLRFKGNGFIYEIWNEWPHSDKNYSDAQSLQSAKDYVNLVKITSKVIRQNDSTALIIGGGFNPVDYKDRVWGKYIIDYDVLNYLDGLSIHPYTYFSNHYTKQANVIDFLNDYTTSLQSNAHKKIKLFITEYGYSTYEGKYSIDVETLINNIKKLKVSLKNNDNISGLWWYDLVNDGDDKNNIEDNFGLFDKNLSPKPHAIWYKLK